MRNMRMSGGRLSIHGRPETPKKKPVEQKPKRDGRLDPRIAVYLISEARRYLTR